MSQNTVEAGHTKALVPEHRYDTTDGGLNLWNTMVALFERFSNDSIRCRTAAISLAPNAEYTFEHNLGMPASGLEIKAFCPDELPMEAVTACLEFTYPSQDSLVIKNVSGANKTGRIVVSGILHNRSDTFRLRELTSPPPAQAGEVVLYAEGVNLLAK